MTMSMFLWCPIFFFIEENNQSRDSDRSQPFVWRNRRDTACIAQSSASFLLCCFLFLHANSLPSQQAQVLSLDSCLPEFLTTQMMDKLCGTLGNNHRIKMKSTLSAERFLSFWEIKDVQMLLFGRPTDKSTLQTSNYSHILSERDILSISYKS